MTYCSNCKSFDCPCVSEGDDTPIITVNDFIENGDAVLDAPELELNYLELDSACNVNDLTGIERFKNLEELHLFGLDLSDEDLSDLRKLPKLKELYVNKCRLRKFSDLSSLKNLQIINLADNWIRDINHSNIPDSVHTLVLKGNHIFVADPKIEDKIINVRHLETGNPKRGIASMTDTELF